MKHLLFKECLSVFEKQMQAAGYKQKSIKHKLDLLKPFGRYLERKEIEDVRDVTAQDLHEFAQAVQEAVSKKGTPYSEVTWKAMLMQVRHLFKCLYIHELILQDTGQDLKVQRSPKRYTRPVFTRDEITRFLDGIDLDQPGGLRDRALFELMYATGIRLGEALNLDIGDIDFKEKMLLIRNGKMGKDRIVPVGTAAMRFLGVYVAGREEKKSSPVFSGNTPRLSSPGVHHAFWKWMKQAGISRKGLCIHSIRHATATHLLENGADIRYVQELLGHESVDTTSIYTHAVYENMKKVYRMYHPRENEYYMDASKEYDARIAGFVVELTKEMKENMATREKLERRNPTETM